MHWHLATWLYCTRKQEAAEHLPPSTAKAALAHLEQNQDASSEVCQLPVWARLIHPKL